MDGLTRRELFLMGNAVALPTRLRRLDAAAEAARARTTRSGTADLSVDWRRACHQLPRHLHPHSATSVSEW